MRRFPCGGIPKERKRLLHWYDAYAYLISLSGQLPVWDLYGQSAGLIASQEWDAQLTQNNILLSRANPSVRYLLSLLF